MSQRTSATVLVPSTGFEPVAFALSRRCSTAELAGQCWWSRVSLATHDVPARGRWRHSPLRNTRDVLARYTGGGYSMIGGCGWIRTTVVLSDGRFTVCCHKPLGHTPICSKTLGRDSRVRTCDLTSPRRARYLAALYPDQEPLATSKLWWRRPASNRQPSACKAGALPIELRPL